jgi:uncharacterized metal-binding protein YceD (DUF177 family)
VTDRFAHHLRLDQLRDGERIELVADDEERDAIAARLGLAGLDCFQAHATLTRKAAAITVEGRILASLTQSCVVTGEPLPAHVDEAFRLIFIPEPEVSRPDEEIELGSADCDVIFHDGATIDLGAALADTLALSLDPYPRSAGAEAALKEAGVLSEAESGPFAVLAQLKKSGDAP